MRPAGSIQIVKVHGLENALVRSPFAFLSRYSYRKLKRTDLRNLHMFDNPEKVCPHYFVSIVERKILQLRSIHCVEHIWAVCQDTTQSVQAL